MTNEVESLRDTWTKGFAAFAAVNAATALVFGNFFYFVATVLGAVVIYLILDKYDIFMKLVRVASPRVHHWCDQLSSY